MKIPDAPTKEYAIPDQGTHAAVITGIVDLGTQEGPDFHDPTRTRLSHRIDVAFSLPYETFQWEDKETGDVEDRPMAVFTELTLTWGDKAKLKKLFKAAFPKHSDDQLRALQVEDLLGKPLNVTVAHRKSAKGKTFANVADFAPLTKGITLPEVATELRWFTLESMQPGDSLPEWIPPWKRDKIMQSEEMKSLQNEAFEGNRSTWADLEDVVDTPSSPEFDETANDDIVSTEVLDDDDCPFG